MEGDSKRDAVVKGAINELGMDEDRTAVDDHGR